MPRNARHGPHRAEPSHPRVGGGAALVVAFGYVLLGVDIWIGWVRTVVAPDVLQQSTPVPRRHLRSPAETPRRARGGGRSGPARTFRPWRPVRLAACPSCACASRPAACWRRAVVAATLRPGWETNMIAAA